MKTPNIFKSNKFWLAMAGVVAMIINDYVPTVSSDELANIIYLIVAMIVGLSVEEYINKKE